MGMDEKKPASTPKSANQESNTNHRIDNTTPTLYPEVDFVNRTLP